MQTALSDKDVKMLLDRLKQDLRVFPEGMNSLEIQFDSAAKHIPAYLKIVKGHISQLAEVLELETHDHRNIDNVGLAEPVTQLMQLFRDLDEHDIQLIETLAYETRNWQASAGADNIAAKEAVKNIPTEA